MNISRWNVQLWLATCLVWAAPAGCGAYFVSPKPTAQPVTLAAEFSLPSAQGNAVSLQSLLATERPAVVVFYRGYW